MLKYIYVFILIIILFWIKWKLQKNNKVKEEFSDQTAEKLNDMFSSSDETLSFYDKISKLKSNIDVNDNIIVSVNYVVNFTDPNDENDNNRVIFILNPVDNKSLNIKDLYLYSSNNEIYSIWNGVYTQPVVTLFKTNEEITTPINTSLSNLLQWHNETYTKYENNI